MRGTASAKALRKRVPDLFEGQRGQCGQSRMSAKRHQQRGPERAGLY